MRLLTLTLFLLSCSRPDAGSDPTLSLKEFQAKRDEVCKTFDITMTEHCDRSTFHVLTNAMCDLALPTQYEYPEGKWNRDIVPCYPTDSRSETSQDTYLSLIMSQDTDAIKRAYVYAESQNWETGEPAGSSGYITLPLQKLMKEYAGVSLAEEADSVIDDTIETAGKIFVEHRGHLTAEYLWALARKRGELSAVGVAWLKKLSTENPESPLMSCLYHRFSDGKQSSTLKLLDNIGTNNFGWGDHYYQHQLPMAVKCLEGK